MRGEIYEMSNDRRARGHEQKGRRYAVVLQSDVYAELSTVIVAPTTSKEEINPRRYRPRVQIEGLGESFVLVEHMRAVDRTLLGKRVGNLTRSELDEVLAAVRLVLDLN